jgi:hypothetical protein
VGAQSLPYGARTRRLFSNFATPNGEGREGLLHQTVTRSQHMAFRRDVCPPSSRFHHLDGLHTRQVRAGCSLTHGQRGTPLPLVSAIPPHVVRIGKTSEFQTRAGLLFSIALLMVLAHLATFLRQRLAGGVPMFDGAAAL